MGAVQEARGRASQQHSRSPSTTAARRRACNLPRAVTCVVLLHWGHSCSSDPSVSPARATTYGRAGRARRLQACKGVPERAARERRGSRAATRRLITPDRAHRSAVSWLPGSLTLPPGQTGHRESSRRPRPKKLSAAGRLASTRNSRAATPAAQKGAPVPQQSPDRTSGSLSHRAAAAEANSARDASGGSPLAGSTDMRLLRGHGGQTARGQTLGG